MTLVLSRGDHSKAERDEIYRKFLLMPDNKAVEQIKLDLARTLTHHQMFEEKLGDGQMKLLRVLKAYSYYNSEVGYCQVRMCFLFSGQDNQFGLAHFCTLQGHVVSGRDPLDSASGRRCISRALLSHGWYGRLFRSHHVGIA